MPRKDSLPKHFPGVSLTPLCVSIFYFAANYKALDQYEKCVNDGTPEKRKT